MYVSHSEEKREQLSSVADAEAAVVGAGGHLTPFPLVPTFPTTVTWTQTAAGGTLACGRSTVVKASALLRLYCALMGLLVLGMQTADTYQFFKWLWYSNSYT